MKHKYQNPDLNDSKNASFISRSEILFICDQTTYNVIAVGTFNRILLTAIATGTRTRGSLLAREISAEVKTNIRLRPCPTSPRSRRSEN